MNIVIQVFSTKGSTCLRKQTNRVAFRISQNNSYNSLGRIIKKWQFSKIMSRHLIIKVH